MSKKRKRISRRRLAGQRVMAHVPIYHIETGKHKPVTAARRFIAERMASLPLQFSMSEEMNTPPIDFFGVKKGYLAPNMLKKIIFYFHH